MPISLKAAQGGGGLIKLAPELARAAGPQIITLDPSKTTEQLALSLDGKFAISALQLKTENWPGTSISLRLEVDGEIIWNSSFPFSQSTAARYLDMYNGASVLSPNVRLSEAPFGCESSLRLYVTMAAAAAAPASLSFGYLARPIK